MPTTSPGHKEHVLMLQHVSTEFISDQGDQELQSRRFQKSFFWRSIFVAKKLNCPRPQNRPFTKMFLKCDRNVV